MKKNIKIKKQIIRMKKKKSIMDFFGAFDEESRKEWVEIKRMLEKDRNKFKLRDFKF